MLSIAAQVVNEASFMPCSIGEKRKLRIPPHLGYGERGSPPKIPGKLDTLVLQIQLRETFLLYIIMRRCLLCRRFHPCI